MNTFLIFVILLLSISSPCLSQKNSVAYIKYGVQSTLTESEIKKQMNKTRKELGSKGVLVFTKHYEQLEKLEFELFIYKGKSKFKLKDFLEPENPDDRIGFRMAKISAGGSSVLFYNTQSKELKSQSKYQSQLFNVKEKTLSWKITNEEKKIKSYTCYKATATDTFQSRNGEATRDYYAWFTPDIPLPYGPEKCVGLPGLVLEAKVRSNIIYRVSSIEISPSAASEDDVQLKPGGKDITNEKYQALHRNAIRARKN